MLTADLVRINVRNAVVKPAYLDASKDNQVAHADDLVRLFTEHVGASRGELDDALTAATAGSRDFRISRGLAKLLLDRTEVAVGSALEPRVVREWVFSAATAHHPVSPEQRQAVLEAAAKELGGTIEDVEHALYSDLKANQRIDGFKKLSGEQLIHRYNLALAQAVVQNSAQLEVTLRNPSPKRVRQLLRYLKFHRLMYLVERLPGGYRFVLDGPLAVIKHSQRYGLQLANFLPALLLCESWSLQCDYKKKGARRTASFTLDSTDCPLVTHYKDTGTWTADEEKALKARLSELAAPYKVSARAALIDLDGRDLLVPDLTITNPENGKKAHLEVLWRWRKSALTARWQLLRKSGPKNVVLALCTSAAQEAPPDLKGPVHVFKHTPNARTLLAIFKELLED